MSSLLSTEASKHYSDQGCNHPALVSIRSIPSVIGINIAVDLNIISVISRYCHQPSRSTRQLQYPRKINQTVAVPPEDQPDSCSTPGRSTRQLQYPRKINQTVAVPPEDQPGSCSTPGRSDSWSTSNSYSNPFYLGRKKMVQITDFYAIAFVLIYFTFVLLAVVSRFGEVQEGAGH